MHPSTYKIPACADRPLDWRVGFYAEGENSEETIHKSKAVGEPPLMLAISAWLALSDALSGINGDKIDGATYPGLDAPAHRNGFCYVQTGLGLVLSKGGSTSALRNSWLGKVLSELADGRDIVLVTVTATKGSSPRNAGARMLITADEIWQTIGGGAVEFDIMARAAKCWQVGMMAGKRQHLKIALGPDMGQCCGGQMSILLEKFSTKQRK